MDNWTSTGKRMKVEAFLAPHAQVKSTWVKDLNARAAAVNSEDSQVESFVTADQAVASRCDAKAKQPK